MTQFKMSIVALSLTSSMAMAAPSLLITHNLTGVESNAYIVGTIPSQHPTKAYTDNKVPWAAVRLACVGHNPCWAMIKMATDTGNPVELGKVTIDVTTGMITPSSLTANGYTMIVNGPAETTLMVANR
jgi:hypothetical protein